MSIEQFWVLLAEARFQAVADVVELRVDGGDVLPMVTALSGR